MRTLVQISAITMHESPPYLLYPYRGSKGLWRRDMWPETNSCTKRLYIQKPSTRQFKRYTYIYILHNLYLFIYLFYTTQICWYTVFELNIFQFAAAFTDRNINEIYSRSTQFLNSLQNCHTTFHTSQWADSWLWGHNALLIGWNVTEADGKAGY